MIHLYVIPICSFLVVCIIIISSGTSSSIVVEGFPMKSPSGGGPAAPSSKTIYGIPNSGWTSPSWNWGYGSGTGHDCAAICRQKYSSKEERLHLINSLLKTTTETMNIDFEEVKLVMALAWQRGRGRNGSDGGPGGYGDVLAMMADAKRYEDDSDNNSKILLFRDMRERYYLLDPNNDDKIAMENLDEENNDGDINTTLQSCSGLVLKAMGFIRNGI